MLFEKKGSANTEMTLKLAVKRAEELELIIRGGIHHGKESTIETGAGVSVVR